MFLELAPILGGIFLIIGSIFIYFGSVFKSMLFYLFADLCWVVLAYSTGNIFGMISILIGIFFSLGVFYKMHIGNFRTSLLKEKNA